LKSEAVADSDLDPSQHVIRFEFGHASPHGRA
jgi:hypothetical protein